MSKPSIIITTKPLPFNALSPLEFERMTLWLVERKGYLRPQHLGEGGNEQGRDIVAYKATDTGEKLCYFQCKRYKKVSSSVFTNEIDKYNELIKANPTKRPFYVIFVTNAVVSAKIREKVKAYCEKYGYNCEFWAHTELDLYIKKYPDIVKEFFSTNMTISALHQLPAPPHDFTGRKSELTTLMHTFEQNGGIIFGLYGASGIGKTTLALKLAEQLASRYTDAQFYLDLKGTSREPLLVSEAMKHIIRAYYPTTPLPQTQAELEAVYRSVLHDQRAILLFDNAANAKQVAPLIPPSSCLLLVTSRRRFILPGLYPKSLSKLPPADACDLLLQINADIGDYASQIAQLCGYLPLALRLAASALTERIDLSPADYVQRLANAQQRLKLIDASLKLSYELLDKQMQQWWCMLAIFPDSFDHAAAGGVWELDLYLAKDILSELVAFNFIEWNSLSHRYHLHELVRLFANAHLSQTDRAITQKRHSKYYLEVINKLARLYKQGGEAMEEGLKLFDLEWTNFQAGQSWAAVNMEFDDEAPKLCNLYPDEAYQLLNLRRSPYECIQWVEKGLAAAYKLNNELAIEIHLGNMGVPYLRLGDAYQAIDLFKQSLDIAYERKNWDHATNMLINIAAAYTHLGEMEKATIFYEKIWSIKSEISNPDMLSGLLHNLGATHLYKGNIDQAVVVYEYLLNLQDKLENWPAQGSALNSLSNAYADLGKTEKAIECLNQALVIAQKIEDKRLESDVLGNLGLIYIELGKPEVAHQLFEQALDISRKIGDRQGEGEKLSKLGAAYLALGKADKALHLCKQALIIAHDIGDKRTESFIHGLLALIYNENRNSVSAIAAMQRRVDYHRDIKHSDAENMVREFDEYRLQEEAESMIELGKKHFKLKKFDYAIGFFKQALRIYRKLANEIGEGAALGCISDVYIELGKNRHAVKHLEQSLTIAHKIGNRKLEAMINWNLQSIRLAQNNLTQEYLTAMQQSVDYWRETDHPKVEERATYLKELRFKYVRSLIDIAENYIKSHKPNQSIIYLKKALNNSLQIDDSDIQILLHFKLGQVYLKLGQADYAIRHLKQVCLIASQVGDEAVESAAAQILKSIYKKL